MTYDAIVVGARCAGSPTAMLLARNGHRVLLLDKAAFPSDTLSTHYIHQPGVACLDRWGVLPEIARSGCPPIRSLKLDVGPFALEGAPPPVDGVGDAYSVRRTVLDFALARAAVEAGAELRQRFAVEELVTDGERVTGIRGRDLDSGATVTERARIVIGADGLSSVVAREVGAPKYNDRGTLTCAYYSYWSGVEMDAAELYARPGRMIVAAPTNDGQVLAIVLWPNGEFHRIRSDIEGHFLEALELAPGLAERIRNGTRSERFRGTARLPNFYRRAHGDGWALVGDAGYHKDPILALGITDAFRDAELLADAVDAGLSGARPLAAALADYERRRDELSAQGFESTVEFARLEPPPPERQQLLGALLGDQEQTNRFIGTFAGTVSAAEFFAPENVARILGEDAQSSDVVAVQAG
jgi:flavin-dependent dehydrogenase